jgi:branched-subunit amino acid ABC-type transport system permease component
LGLALIFGLMDVVNFAHGEFLMIAMYRRSFCSRSLPSIPCWRRRWWRPRCSCSGRWFIC